LVCCGVGDPKFYTREPGTPWRPFDVGWQSPHAAFSEIRAKADNHNVTVTRRNAEACVRTLREEMEGAALPNTGLLIIFKDGTASLIEGSDVELIGDVDRGAMVRLAIEQVNYPYEIWSRPGWARPGAA
jgi:hypothetical protein